MTDFITYLNINSVINFLTSPSYYYSRVIVSLIITYNIFYTKFSSKSNIPRYYYI